MKISKLTFIALLLTAGFLAFCAGWFFRGGNARPVSIMVERRLPEADETLVLSPPETESMKVDINTATAEELQVLPGIGEKRAADIIAYRAQHGPFRIPEDITKVGGIGEGTLEELLPYITAGGAEP